MSFLDSFPYNSDHVFSASELNVRFNKLSNFIHLLHLAFSSIKVMTFGEFIFLKHVF